MILFRDLTHLRLFLKILEAAEEAIEDALECKEIKEVMENYFDNIFISFCYSFKLCQRYTIQAENLIYLAPSIPKKSCDSFTTIDMFVNFKE